MHKKITLFAGLILLAVSCSRATLIAPLPQSQSNSYNRQLQVSKNILSVEIVSDIDKMQIGLSGRQTLGENEGMLFDFKTSQTDLNFWMKDMLFNIDIIWIADKKIIGITPNVPSPEKDKGLRIKDLRLPTYSPPSPVTQVLEVNAGWSQKNNIKVGDEIQLVN